MRWRDCLVGGMKDDQYWRWEDQHWRECEMNGMGY